MVSQLMEVIIQFFFPIHCSLLRFCFLCAGLSTDYLKPERSRLHPHEKDKIKTKKCIKIFWEYHDFSYHVSYYYFTKRRIVLKVRIHDV